MFSLRKMVQVIGILITLVGLVWFLKISGDNWDRVMTSKQTFEAIAPALLVMLVGNIITSTLFKTK